MMRRGLALAVWFTLTASMATFAFNLIETAGPVGEQQVALTFGVGLVATELGGEGTWYLAPQGRLTIGLLQGLDLGVQSGWLSGIGTQDTKLLGVLFDVKIVSTHVPDMYSFAWGAGGGYGLDFFGEGWGVFLQLLVESHSPYFPVFVTYRSILPFDIFSGGPLEFESHIAGGLRLQLAPIARLLLVFDVYHGLTSLGLGLEIAF